MSRHRCNRLRGRRFPGRDALRRIRAALCALAGTAALAGAVAAADSHWAWKPPERPAIPADAPSGWARGAIDALLAADLGRERLEPAAGAGREELIRRASFDVTGLPPEPRAIDDFLADDRPDAWERVVDRLLASPRFGERWGRHWLDLARYAESNGFEHDELRPDAWRYRDYVIRSLNADKPYDRFVCEQIAGDEMAPDDPEALIATGFNLLGPDMTDAADQAVRRYNRLSDMTDTAGSVFLGLTLGCARCHDHKLEPLSQVDYFALHSFFAPAELRSDLVVATEPESTRHRTALAAYRQAAGPVEEALAELERPYREKLREEKLSRIADEARAAHRTPAAQRTAAQRELAEKTERLLAVSADEVAKALGAEHRARRAEIEQELKLLAGKKPAPLPTALGLASPAGDAPPARVLERGDVREPGAVIAPAVPAVLAAAARPLETIGAPALGRRSALARWLVQPGHPLSSRVIANRVWQRCFGRGIVATPSDFGHRGDRPTHPELLDWLALELVERQWSLKALLREILVSSAYRMATAAAGAALEHDPDNRWLWRQNRRRLEAEAIRDAWLAAAGTLDLRVGGPGAAPPKDSAQRASHRRSVYLQSRRNLRLGLFEGLDPPDTNATCPQRTESLTAAQALTLLNAPEVTQAAAALAARLEREATSQAARVELAFRLVLGRMPSAVEAAQAEAFLVSSPLAELARALFNANEAVYID